MLNKIEVMIRFMVALALYILSGTETVTGLMATFCGVLATVELATALLHYSPLIALLEHISISSVLHRYTVSKNR